MPIDDARMTFGDHVEALRTRLIRVLLGVLAGMVICFVFRRYLWAIVRWPLAAAIGGGGPLPLQAIAPPEGFTTLLKLCLVTGAILASPYGLYQMWQFVGAGLYEAERKAVRRYLVPSMLLFLLGVAFFFVVAAPIILQFFLVFTAENYADTPDWMVDWLPTGHVRDAPPATTAPADAARGDVETKYHVSEYISFVAVLSLVFGIGFQTPLVVLFLAGTGIVTIEAMRSFRAYVFLVILVLSAFITPPDWVSMVALALPMYALYEIGLAVAALRRRRSRRRMT